MRAALEFNPGGKNESIGGPGRTILVLASPPEVFNADIDLFIWVPDEISCDIVGVIVCIPTEKLWVVRVYIAI